MSIEMHVSLIIWSGINGAFCPAALLSQPHGQVRPSLLTYLSEKPFCLTSQPKQELINRETSSYIYVSSYIIGSSQNFPRMSKRKRAANGFQDLKKPKLTDTIIPPVERINAQLISIPYCSKNGKPSEVKYESQPRFTTEEYKYSIVVRPNGLKHTDSYGEAVGIWFNPLPSDADDNLLWPAKIKMQLSLLKSESKEKILKIPMKEYKWERYWTKSQYPAFNFDFKTLQHSAIQREGCVDSDGFLTILIEEGAV